MPLFQFHGSHLSKNNFLSRLRFIKKNNYFKLIFTVFFFWLAVTYISHVFSINIVSQINIKISSFFIEWTYRPIRMIQDMKSSYWLSKDVYDENNRLKSELLVLQHKNESLIAELKTLHHLETLYDKLTFFPQKKVIARVLGSMYSFSKATMVLSLPQDQDPEVIQSMVFTEDGLVGRILQISAEKATVLMVTDHQSRIPVRCKRNGVQALLLGNGSLFLDVDLIDSILDTDELGLCADDILYTSGLDDIFAPDIPVAKIVSIKDDAIKAKPIVDLSTIQFAYVSEKKQTNKKP